MCALNFAWSSRAEFVLVYDAGGGDDDDDKETTLPFDINYQGSGVPVLSRPEVSSRCTSTSICSPFLEE